MFIFVLIGSNVDGTCQVTVYFKLKHESRLTIKMNTFDWYCVNDSGVSQFKDIKPFVQIASNILEFLWFLGQYC